MRLSDAQIQQLDLEHTIQAYALSMSDVDCSGNRVPLHSRLCELLRVPVSDFKPFDCFELLTFMFETTVYENLLRREVQRLQERDKQ